MARTRIPAGIPAPTFQNLQTGRYLQVLKGPISQEQTAMIGKPYVLFGEKVIATTQFDFDAHTGRVPGFGIFEKNGRFALMAGGNENRSQLIKEGNKAVLYVVKDQNAATYNWRLIAP